MDFHQLEMTPTSPSISLSDVEESCSDMDISSDVEITNLVNKERIEVFKSLVHAVSKRVVRDDESLSPPFWSPSLSPSCDVEPIMPLPQKSVSLQWGKNAQSAPPFAPPPVAQKRATFLDVLVNFKKKHSELESPAPKQSLSGVVSPKSSFELFDGIPVTVQRVPCMLFQRDENEVLQISPSYYKRRVDLYAGHKEGFYFIREHSGMAYYLRRHIPISDPRVVCPFHYNYESDPEVDRVGYFVCLNSIQYTARLNWNDAYLYLCRGERQYKKLSDDAKKQFVRTSVGPFLREDISSGYVLEKLDDDTFRELSTEIKNLFTFYEYDEKTNIHTFSLRIWNIADEASTRFDERSKADKVKYSVYRPVSTSRPTHFSSGVVSKSCIPVKPVESAKRGSKKKKLNKKQKEKKSSTVPSVSLDVEELERSLDVVNDSESRTEKQSTSLEKRKVSSSPTINFKSKKSRQKQDALNIWSKKGDDSDYQPNVSSNNSDSDSGSSGIFSGLLPCDGKEVA
jgi:hypothetical protein